MKTIVALVDFSDLTAKVLAQARIMAEAFKCRVVLLHGLERRPVVMDLGVASPTVLEKITPETIEADLAKLMPLAAPMKSVGIQVSVEQLSEATVDAILEEAQKLKADLIVVGSHHHGPLYDLVVGSVTAGVLKRATCPVLVVPKD